MVVRMNLRHSPEYDELFIGTHHFLVIHVMSCYDVYKNRENKFCKRLFKTIYKRNDVVRYYDFLGISNFTVKCHKCNKPPRHQFVFTDDKYKVFCKHCHS